MDIIEFKDLPSTDTPVSASNLNRLQQNIKTDLDKNNENIENLKTNVNNLGMSVNDLANSTIYSTDEIIVGSWMDKPIYRKVIEFGALPNSSMKGVEPEIENLEQVVKLSGIAYLTNGSPAYIPLPRANVDNFLNIGLEYYEGQVLIVTRYDFSNYEAKIIIEYTKN